eukprot:3521044-Ditylum_brightwellii.AAC.1
MVFKVENNAAGFLGVSIKRNEKNQMIMLTQSGLIDRIVEALGLEDAMGLEAPVEVAPLRKDLFGDKGNATFNYLHMIGMMLYLSSHSQPDIQYAVLQCAHFLSNPKASHEAALKQIGRYLKETRNKGLVIGSVVDSLDINCFVDADFTGLWASEATDDPDYARSHTGFVITLCNCSIIWASKIQKEQSSSTMEAEYAARNTAMKDLLPFQCLVKELIEKNQPSSWSNKHLLQSLGGQLQCSYFGKHRAQPFHSMIKTLWDTISL